MSLIQKKTNGIKSMWRLYMQKNEYKDKLIISAKISNRNYYKNKWSKIEWLCHKFPDVTVYFLSFSFKATLSFSFLKLILVCK